MIYLYTAPETILRSILKISFYYKYLPIIYFSLLPTFTF